MSQKAVKKIFVVDDDEILSMALEDYISSRSSHKVSVFSTGEECLKHLREQPNVVILDYNLNSEFKDAANGMQILQAIKNINKQIHVIMLSSQEEYGTALQTISKGAEDYVIKDNDAFKKIIWIIDALD
jgi:two-component system, OmpR family, response regulator